MFFYVYIAPALFYSFCWCLTSEILTKVILSSLFQVYLDGRNVKELNLAWLRRQIGVVSQEPVLFATTIEENVRFGNPEATLDEIIVAAKEADAHGFINKLPDVTS